MKKHVVFIMAMLFSASVFCQDQPGEAEKKLRFGIKAGVAIADQQYENNQNSIDHGYKAGGMVGIFVRTPLNSNLYFQPELLMVGKGTKQAYQYYESRSDFTYIELPLNLLFKSSKSRSAFFIGGGPAPSVLIGENIFYYGYTSAQTFDLGINMLAGYELPIGFSVNLNYTHGLMNVAPDEENVPKIKNRSFGITIGYIFQ